MVPKKEGAVRPYMTIEQVTQGYKYKKAVLLDNNILGGGKYAIEQLELIIEHNIRVDFNQAMDARLVTEEIARLLAKIKWLTAIRFGCDTNSQIKPCENVMQLINSYGYTGQYMFYTMIHGDLLENYNRISYWKRYRNVRCQSQPQLDFTRHQVLPQWQKDLARWSNRKEFYMVCDFKDFSPRKGFYCKTYFE